MRLALHVGLAFFGSVGIARTSSSYKGPSNATLSSRSQSITSRSLACPTAMIIAIMMT